MSKTPSLTKAYFGQDAHYYSGSKDTLVTIADMPRTYAANAARRLLDDAMVWASEAEIDQPGRTATLWVMTSKLWQALHARAVGTEKTVEASAYRDRTGDLWVRNSGGGWRVEDDTDRSDIEFMGLVDVENHWGPLTRA